MKQLQLLLRDRRRRQRGSILSSVLIIVAFLSILVGALMTELTNSFLLSRTLVTRMQSEATVSSAVELAINRLQNDVQSGTVPANCAQDARRAPSMPTLNQQFAHVMQQKCIAIVPEVATSLASGSFEVDGIHDTVAGRNRYLVANKSGSMYSYNFSTGNLTWQVSIGGQPTAPPSTMASTGNSVDILVPVANKIVVFNEPRGSAPTFRCNLAASATVRASAAAGVSFPDYAFFGDSGGKLYVYDTSSSGCGPAALTSVAVGGRVVGAPLVFSSDPGESGSDEVIVLVTTSSSTSLKHFSYTEPLVCNNGNDEGDCDHGGRRKQPTFTPAGSLQLNGSNALGYDTNGSALPMNLVVATGSGRLDLAQINSSYRMSPVASIALPDGAVTAGAPYWCQCPGPDLIGVGGTNGKLYLFTTRLSPAYQYDGQADGRPAINTAPMADANGEWYFGANDGYVYDVEIPMGGTQMFKAARFGPGGAIASSPIVGGCPAGPCMYFGSSTAGSYFARIGFTRVSDLRACLSSADGSTCVGNPQLWAQVAVGSAASGPNTITAKGVSVQG
ncbi:MAG: hypothetical protein M3R21_00880, partial [Candidatus Dormibacteraeota bacterium]|nr:hypothetical protein [Candidatus Dormibacteraeota bacterium]